MYQKGFSRTTDKERGGLTKGVAFKQVLGAGVMRTKLLQWKRKLHFKIDSRRRRDSIFLGYILIKSGITNSISLVSTFVQHRKDT
jgi:hypothetical protein